MITPFSLQKHYMVASLSWAFSWRFSSLGL